MRRVVFVAAVLRRIVRRRDDDAVGKARFPSLVVGQDRMRDDRRRRVAAVLVDHDLDAVGRKHLDRARQRRLGQRVGIDADEQRTVQAGFAAIVADRLRGREDMILVEGVFQRRAAMPRGSEGDALGGIGRVRLSMQNRRSQAAGCWQERRDRPVCRRRNFVQSRDLSEPVQPLTGQYRAHGVRGKAPPPDDLIAVQAAM